MRSINVLRHLAASILILTGTTSCAAPPPTPKPITNPPIRLDANLGSEIKGYCTIKPIFLAPRTPGNGLVRSGSSLFFIKPDYSRGSLVANEDLIKPCAQTVNEQCNVISASLSTGEGGFVLALVGTHCQDGFLNKLENSQ